MQVPIAEVIVMMTLPVLAAWIIITIVNGSRRARVTRTHMEMCQRVLDKFGSSAEMAEFLKTEEGRQLMAAPMDDPAQGGYGRILRSVQVGIVLGVVGAAALFLAVQSDEREFVLLGFMTVALAIAFLLAAAASYVLSRRWGLIQERPTERP